MMACAPCVVSIFEHHRDTPCEVYVIAKSLPASDVEGLQRIAQEYGQRLYVRFLDMSIFNGIKVCERFRESVYYRFMLPDMFPEYDRMIYLDCDIVLNGSLLDFWNTEIDGFACGVVEDQESDDIILHNRIGVYTTYFNSGVLLVNLAYWREHGILQKLVDFIRANPEKCIYPDQDALNAVLQGQVKFFPYCYNFQNLWFTDLRWVRLHASKFKEVEKWKDSPVVVHFAGDDKPWKKYCRHPFTQYYLDCLAKTPWRIPHRSAQKSEEYQVVRHDRSYHKYIRRFNRLLAVLIVETLAFVAYLLWC